MAVLVPAWRLRASTVAPGSTAPEASLTTPWMDTVCSWAEATLPKHKSSASTYSMLALRYICPPIAIKTYKDVQQTRWRLYDSWDQIRTVRDEMPAEGAGVGTGDGTAGSGNRPATKAEYRENGGPAYPERPS